MKNIQEYKKWLEAEKSKAANTNDGEYSLGKFAAYDEALMQLTLLLKEETAKDLPCTCENSKLGQTICDKTCVDADEYS